MMKKSGILSIVSAFSLLLCSTLGGWAAQDRQNPQQKYVERYAGIAVEEMYRTGVPASITLAQGLLESGAGLSTLAAKSNNHFGIKCHDWKGRKVYHDDDRKNECFRAYDDPAESFRDHSDFLRYRDRYKFLFEYKTTDYKSWAKGLKKAGYATDPNYAEKLIRYVEDLELYRFDTMSSATAQSISQSQGPESADGQADQGRPLSRREQRALRRARKKAEKEARKQQETGEDVIPASPLSIEKPEKYTPEADETFHFNLYRQMFSRNGVPYITVMEGETLETIARDFDLFEREICAFNDLKPGTPIQEGDIIYIQAKKKQGARDMDMYIVDRDGERLWSISQRFGVRLKSILRLNGLSEDSMTREGDTILLRNRKKR